MINRHKDVHNKTKVQNNGAVTNSETLIFTLYSI